MKLHGRLGPRGLPGLAARRRRPGRDRGRGRGRRRRPCAATPTGRPRWSATSPAWSPRSAPRPVLVVDRPGWVQANADGFSAVLGAGHRQAHGQEGCAVRVSPWRSAPASPAPRSACCWASWRARCSASSTRSTSRPAGCCSSPPTSSTSSASSRADPADFRLWVCLHEETHRVQFTAVPWMRDHLFGEMDALADTVEPTRLLDDGIKRISEAVRGERQPDRGARHARAARDPRPGHRRDVAPRGSRRRRHGRRRARR